MRRNSASTIVAIAKIDKKISLLMKLLGWAFIIWGCTRILSNLSFTPFDSSEVTSAGVLIALGGLFLTQARAAQEREEKRSQFYLDSCVMAYEEARKLLIDGNNDRATWIAAGRALKYAKELSHGITGDSRLHVLELQKLKYRGFFYDALKQSASFFYGVDATLPLDKAAETSTAQEEHDGRITVSTNHELSKKSLYAVWEAAQWDEDYKDPLDKEFSPEQSRELVIFFPGLGKYLEHKATFRSAAGVLRTNTQAIPGVPLADIENGVSNIDQKRSHRSHYN
jgi:hypothetical protein